MEKAEWDELLKKLDVMTDEWMNDGRTYLLILENDNDRLSTCAGSHYELGKLLAKFAIRDAGFYETLQIANSLLIEHEEELRKARQDFLEMQRRRS